MALHLPDVALVKDKEGRLVRKVLLRLFLLLVGGLVGTGVIEVGLRVLYPGSLLGAGQLRLTAGEQTYFQFDEEFGYMPRLGTQAYDTYGCVPNNYDVKDRKGRQRVLFVGDSVTHRGAIQNGLQELYGDEHYEYWNAGVESFNTAQVVAFYRRINYKVEPNQVVLTFHNNDFQDTPLVSQEDGKLRIFMFGKDRERVNLWWFDNSYLYRWLIGIQLGRLDRSRQRQVVQQSLRELKMLLAEQGVPLRAVIFPILLPLQEWREESRWSRQTSLEILREEGIECIDLLPSLEQALAKGMVVQQAPGDNWHPSVEAGRHFAKELKSQNLLIEP